VISLLDCHFEADKNTATNPWREDEVLIGRCWNRDLDWSLRSKDFLDAYRTDVDMHRPQHADISFQLKRDAVYERGSAMAIETHCNNGPENQHGWLIEVHRGDDMSIRLGTAIAAAWSGVLLGEQVRIAYMPDPRYTYSWLFHNLSEIGCAFVLCELGNLQITKFRRMLLQREQTYMRLVEATAQAIIEVYT
jgi:N-acetylmuramoyl-L-alanine amidase